MLKGNAEQVNAGMANPNSVFIGKYNNFPRSMLFIEMPNNVRKIANTKLIVDFMGCLPLLLRSDYVLVIAQ